MFRNLATLHDKVASIKELENDADRILLRCIDSMSTLFRCRDCSKEEKKSAASLVKGKRIKIDRLYKMDLPLKQKIKYTPFALLGANIHSLIISLIHKKLD